ncbi:MAG: 4'-phosphopantetheinyl transferase family protein, partial [Planctomycetota bacterium]
MTMRPWLTNIEFKQSARAPEMASDEVHIWRFSLEPADERDALLLSQSILSNGERERAARFRFDSHRARFVASHAALRRVLAQYVQIAPEQIEYKFGAHGKPELANIINIHFNLSHSGAAGVLAVSRSGPVGIDIEQMAPIEHVSELVNRNFSKMERTAFMNISESLQLEAFYRCWTGKEAWIKLQGGGLAIPLDSFDVEID